MWLLKKIVILGLLFAILVFYKGNIQTALSSVRDVGVAFGDVFRQRTPIMPVSEYEGLDSMSISILGFKWQGRDITDRERNKLETGRMMVESGYSAHGLGFYCNTDEAIWLSGGLEPCLNLTHENASRTFKKAKQEQEAAFQAKGCHKKKGFLIPKLKETRRKKCREKALKELYS